MISKVDSITRNVSEREIPEGVYKGFWSAYMVHVHINGNTYEMKTDRGIRGMLIACKVISDGNGHITVTTDD